MDEAKEPGIRIAQIFLLNASFSHGENPLSIPANTTVPVSDVNLIVQNGLNEDETKGFVSVAIASIADDGAMYHFRVEMMALVEVDQEHPNMPLKQYFSVHGPTLLFPFLREAVANLTSRGRFGAVWLHPTNLQSALQRKQLNPPTETPAS